MALIETWFNQDIKQPVKVRYLDGNVFSLDNQGNKIGVHLIDNGQPANISGTVSASVIRSDGATVSFSGSISGNDVYAILPQSAYAVPGVISIIIKLNSGGEVATVCAIVANVYRSSTDSTVDPGTVLPTIETLIAEIETAVASIPSAGFANGSALNPNIFSVADFENGAISQTDGSNTSSSSRIRSKLYIPTTAKYYHSSNSNIRFMLYAWNSVGTYVGAWQTDSTFGTNAGSFSFLDMTQFYEHPAYKDYRYKIVIRSTNGDVQVSNVTGIYIDSLIYDIPENTKRIDVVESFAKVPIFDVNLFENGSIAYATGANASNSNRIRTKDFLPDYANYFYSTNASIRFNIYAWDASGNYVGALYNGLFSTADVTSYPTIDLSIYKTDSNYYGYKYKVVVLLNGGSVQVNNVSGVYIDNIIQIASASDVSGRVLNLSNAYNINDSMLWENGGISLSTGMNVASSSRARTRTTLPTNAGVIGFGTHTQYRGMYILAYTTNGVYVGAYKSDGTFVKDGSETGYSSFDLQQLYREHPNYRFRIAVYVRNSGTDVLPSEYEDWTITNAVYTKPSRLKVIQYNIGKFNMGFAHTDPHITNTSDKILNMKEFFANENPDILCMQEITEYIDTSDTISTDSTLFNPIFFNKSYYEKETAIKCQYPLANTQFSYIHTSGDNPAWVIYGDADIDGRKVAVVSGVLNSSAPEGVNHQEQGIRALTKLTEQLISNYDYAIIGMDCNCISDSEAAAFKSFMDGKGFQSGNWNYLGYKNTYNLSSELYKAIDNVFVKGGKIINFYIPSVYDVLASDHFPAVAEIRFL